MKKTSLLSKTLPALALALALGACGGGGGGDGLSPNNPINPNNPQSGSIVSCFTADSTVSFSVLPTNVPVGQVGPTSSTTGPMTDNTGQAVTGQMFKYTGATITSDTVYWKVNSNGVTLVGELTVPVSGNPSLTPINITFPANMRVGQAVSGMTLLGFDNLTLAGKPFTNVCHFKTPTDEQWYAKDYGMIKKTVSGATYQYNGEGGNPGASGSITACFTANKTVNFSVTANMPSAYLNPNRSTTGPMNYNGQAVTGQTLFYPSESATYTENNYWTVTSSGVKIIAHVDYTGGVTDGNLFYPQNMNPNQTVTGPNNTRSTFVGFETIGLAGKTFSNTCHFNTAGSEIWYASGYGLIKEIDPDGVTIQYAGDL